ncbi:hypothetical protein CWI38_0011p0120 [Hamiltosporidium tvaerminnensis]|uniref:Uncharacterized protein n=1 Tax=Hamiltosporidium tvaerminnensis TaxID=1176355 RepID=A0A4Q9M5P0_9MICR|nr:hypothetical protein CWI38_0011p0120 [Hamiltosporidium tvaerminnensis]
MVSIPRCAVDPENNMKFRLEFLGNIILFRSFNEIYRENLKFKLIFNNLLKKFFEYQVRNFAEIDSSQDIKARIMKMFPQLSTVNHYCNKDSCKLNSNIFKKIGVHTSLLSHEKLLIELDKFSLLSFMCEEVLFTKSFYNQLDYDLCIKIMECISDSIIKKIIIRGDEFQDILDFKMYEFNDMAILNDQNYPKEVIELFVENTKRNKLISMYEILMNISKVEYHKYISDVICLKVFFEEEELTDKEIILRIIIEFLFLTGERKILKCVKKLPRDNSGKIWASEMEYMALDILLNEIESKSKENGKYCTSENKKLFEQNLTR